MSFTEFAIDHSLTAAQAESLIAPSGVREGFDAGESLSPEDLKRFLQIVDAIPDLDSSS